MPKYTASNQNAAPAKAQIETWASTVEGMVSIGLFLALLSYLMMPAMMGGHIFSTLTSGLGLPKEGDLTLTLSQSEARGALWLSALSLPLATQALLYMIVWGVVSILPRWPNMRFLVASGLCVSVCSGHLIRSVGEQVPLPEGAEVPILLLSNWVDIPAIATHGFIDGLSYSVLAPFTVVGVLGIIFALYRMGRDRLESKIKAYSKK
jgi:hypothetical protein